MYIAHTDNIAIELKRVYPETTEPWPPAPIGYRIMFTLHTSYGDTIVSSYEVQELPEQLEVPEIIKTNAPEALVEEAISEGNSALQELDALSDILERAKSDPIGVIKEVLQSIEEGLDGGKRSPSTATLAEVLPILLYKAPGWAGVGGLVWVREVI